MGFLSVGSSNLSYLTLVQSEDKSNSSTITKYGSTVFQDYGISIHNSPQISITISL
nr:MAG TPA: hypothetical protein [Caudoviricetes sp.]